MCTVSKSLVDSTKNGHNTACDVMLAQWR